jgi:hypothetical protein
MFLAHFLDYTLQFRAASGGFIFLDDALDCLFKLISPVGKMFHRLCLIDFGNLFAEIA